MRGSQRVEDLSYPGPRRRRDAGLTARGVGVVAHHRGLRVWGRCRGH